MLFLLSKEGRGCASQDLSTRVNIMTASVDVAGPVATIAGKSFPSNVLWPIACYHSGLLRDIRVPSSLYITFCISLYCSRRQDTRHPQPSEMALIMLHPCVLTIHHRFHSVSCSLYILIFETFASGNSNLAKEKTIRACSGLSQRKMSVMIGGARRREQPILQSEPCSCRSTL